jgi:hypothetical protein
MTDSLAHAAGKKLDKMGDQLWNVLTPRLRITGQRAPGKASPRIERKPISREEAVRRALRVLTPTQRVIAARLVESDTTDMAHR